jgi:hypothetical protein
VSVYFFRTKAGYRHGIGITNRLYGRNAAQKTNVIHCQHCQANNAAPRYSISDRVISPVLPGQVPVVRSIDVQVEASFAQSIERSSPLSPTLGLSILLGVQTDVASPVPFRRHLRSSMSFRLLGSDFFESDCACGLP